MRHKRKEQEPGIDLLEIGKSVFIDGEVQDNEQDGKRKSYGNIEPFDLRLLHKNTQKTGDDEYNRLLAKQVMVHSINA